jgi:hypothetical protein
MIECYLEFNVMVYQSTGFGGYSMASQWHSLASQKIFLARTLLSQHDLADSVPAREALWQGATELSLRSRQLLLVMIARFYQDKQSEPENLGALRAALGDDIPEIAELEALATGSSAWWGYLDQLAHYQMQPPIPKKTVSAENIIAVAADTGPERSSKSLSQALTDLKQFIDALEERHSEW